MSWGFFSIVFVFVGGAAFWNSLHTDLGPRRKKNMSVSFCHLKMSFCHARRAYYGHGRRVPASGAGRAKRDQGLAPDAYKSNEATCFFGSMQGVRDEEGGRKGGR